MITEEHAEPRAFRKLVKGTSSRRERQQIVHHLIAGCERCREQARRTIRPVKDPTSWSYDRVFDRVERRVAKEFEKLRERSAPEPSERQVHA